MAIEGYQILRKLGDGGMSSVYLAIQLSVGREVALKVLAPELRTHEEYTAKFHNEASIVGNLSHPSVVSVYDVQKHGEYHYIAMDYLPGKSCAERIADKSISPNQAIIIAQELALALDYIHNQGVIHADIKPENILFRIDETAVLTDFGIAQRISEAQGNAGKALVAGSPNYMSPEQLQGKSIDGRSDLYSLGVMLYETLTGTLPYHGKDSINIAIKHLSAEIPTLPEHLQQYQEIINKLLAKKPKSRFQSGMELYQALLELEQEMPIGRKLKITHADAGKDYHGISALKAALSLSLASSKARLAHALEHSSPLRFSWSKGIYIKQIASLSHQDLSDLNATSTFGDPAKKHYRIIPIVSLAPLLITTVLLISIAVGLGPLKHQLETLAAPYITINQIEDATPIADDPNAFALEPSTPPAPVATSKAMHTAEEQHIKYIESQEIVEQTFSLTIDTKPKSSRVQVLNIKPQYRRGMQLAPGKYHLKVSHPGYDSRKSWITIDNKNYRSTISLNKSQKRHGEIFIDPLKTSGTGPEMVVIAAGQYKLGAKQQPLRLRNPFAIARHELTLADYDRYTKSMKKPQHQAETKARKTTAVSELSFTQAQEYAIWLSKETARKYRLATPSEWEIAAAANSSTEHWWGNDNAAGKANCRGECKSKWSGMFKKTAAPIGQFQANEFGLYDTAGNLAEWVNFCSDKHCSKAAVRGGHYKSKVDQISHRQQQLLSADTQSPTIGIRLVRELN